VRQAAEEVVTSSLEAALGVSRHRSFPVFSECLPYEPPKAVTMENHAMLLRLVQALPARLRVVELEGTLQVCGAVF
jgi:hypothetical protein